MQTLGFARRVALVVLLVATSAVGAVAQTTVIIVRHAEKAAEPAEDPPLTAAGEKRAQDLWLAVKDAGVSAVVTTQYARTRATAAPTATAGHITPEIVRAGGADDPKEVADAVRRHAGHTVLIVGHSNTVPAIIEALGAVRPPPICDTEYDNLYVVTISQNKAAKLVRAKFGVRTPVDSACAATMR
jgi:broad specificity phosphatase PhoE